jgi:hypothetical protein
MLKVGVSRQNPHYRNIPALVDAFYGEPEYVSLVLKLRSCKNCPKVTN